MTVLDDLTAALREFILDTGAAPAFADTALSRYLQLALADYSRRRPYLALGSFNLVPGQAAYPLPAGFLAFVTEMRPQSYDFDAGDSPWFVSSTPPLVASAPGLVIGAVSGCSFTARVVGGQALLSPVPSFAAVLPFSYYAQHTWDTVPPADHHALVLFAASLAYRALAGDRALLSRYRVGKGGVEVDASRAADQLLALAREARDQYDALVTAAPFGLPG
ncbi:MAG: hypothetical protein IMW94_01470 [Thermoanaerobacter sp.]|nr:hypothetical protein [Thermoanaerobacter sp.]